MAVISKVVAPFKPLQHTADLYNEAMEPVEEDAVQYREIAQAGQVVQSTRFCAASVGDLEVARQQVQASDADIDASSGTHSWQDGATAKHRVRG